MKTVFLNDPDDMLWLQDVHKVPITYQSAVLYGNEDSPSRLDLYLEENPNYDDDYTLWLANEDGGFTIVTDIKAAALLQASKDDPKWQEKCRVSGDITWLPDGIDEARHPIKGKDGRDQFGYGKKIKTERVVRFPFDKQFRRVYATCYSNCASHWVVYKGKTYHLRDCSTPIGELRRLSTMFKVLGE